MHASRLRGLYVITDNNLTEQHQLAQAVLSAIKGGARLLQYRDKSGDDEARATTATMLAALCRQHDVTFIINDDVQLAMCSKAHGVHLGQDDTGVIAARRQLGGEAIIGVSCHGDLELARDAENQGADYVAFGRFFPSHTKPDAPAADTQVLTDAARELSIPCVAIGGITPDNGGSLIHAGADMLAVIHGIFGTQDIEAAARRYAELFD
jgi:thiamine-phosphate pyrophosphorylase